MDLVQVRLVPARVLDCTRDPAGAASSCARTWAQKSAGVTRRAYCRRTVRPWPPRCLRRLARWYASSVPEFGLDKPMNFEELICATLAAQKLGNLLSLSLLGFAVYSWWTRPPPVQVYVVDDDVRPSLDA